MLEEVDLNVVREDPRGPTGVSAPRTLSIDEIEAQQAAPLPDREAMTLISVYPGMGDSALAPEVMPESGTDGGLTSGPTSDATGTYTAGAQDTALGQVQEGQQTAATSSADGVNAPNGTATASNQT